MTPGPSLRARAPGPSSDPGQLQEPPRAPAVGRRCRRRQPRLVVRCAPPAHRREAFQSRCVVLCAFSAPEEQCCLCPSTRVAVWFVWCLAVTQAMRCDALLPGLQCAPLCRLDRLYRLNYFLMTVTVSSVIGLLCLDSDLESWHRPARPAVDMLASETEREAAGGAVSCLGSPCSLAGLHAA